MESLEEDWFSINRSNTKCVATELKECMVACLNEIVDLKNEVKAKNDVIDKMALEISQIKEKLLAKEQVASNDSIYKILEDLKMVKERELNLMLREKIPVPFQYNFTKKPLTPTLAAQMFTKTQVPQISLTQPLMQSLTQLPKINTAL